MSERRYWVIKRWARNCDNETIEVYLHKKGGTTDDRRLADKFVTEESAVLELRDGKAGRPVPVKVTKKRKKRSESDDMLNEFDRTTFDGVRPDGLACRRPNHEVHDRANRAAWRIAELLLAKRKRKVAK